MEGSNLSFVSTTTTTNVLGTLQTSFLESGTNSLNMAELEGMTVEQALRNLAEKEKKRIIEEFDNAKKELDKKFNASA